MQKLHILHNSRPQEETGAPIWWESRGCRGAEGSVSVDGSTVAAPKCRPGNRRGEIHQFEVWSAYAPPVFPFKVDSQVWACRQCGFRQQTREMYFIAHRDRELRRAAVYTVKLSRHWGGKTHPKNTPCFLYTNGNPAAYARKQGKLANIPNHKY